jgi:hypothetical protein
MIAGVHFPQDVIGGLILGVIVLALYIPLPERFVTLWAGWSNVLQIVFSLGIVLLITIVTMTVTRDIDKWRDPLTVAGLLLGGSLAAALEHHWLNFVPPVDVTRRIVVYVLGIILCVALLFGLDFAFEAIAETGTLAGILRVIRYGTVAYFALLTWPTVCVRIGFMPVEEVSKQDEAELAIIGGEPTRRA